MNNVVRIQKLDNVTLDVTIKLTRGFQLRIWIATLLIQFAGFILGANVNVTEEL